ncbi:acetylglutamate kinase [Candidatus Sumerlaeota bacterium]|nr:acetylglutamate kinase [Candidatus Sumerlaeota bacterium]
MNQRKLENLSLEDLIPRAEFLIEALPYIQQFRGQTIVVKYGGSAQLDEELRKNTIKDIVLMELVGMRVVVVHGGGPEVSNMMKKQGLEPRFEDGLRVTDKDTLSITEMVLSGKLSREIVNMINMVGGAKAVGLTGKDGGMVTAHKFQNLTRDGKKGPDIGFVGEVEHVNPSILHTLINEGYIPIISPIAPDVNGQTFNINGDPFAASIARALGAVKFVLLTDVNGIMTDPDDPKSLIQSLTQSEAEELIRQGVISGGMIPKVMACIDALEGGVQRTHILDGRLPHSLLLEIFTHEGIGTMLLPNH